MTVLNLEAQAPFTTKDGSTIRSILDRTNAPVEKQSLAEARVPRGQVIDGGRALGIGAELLAVGEAVVGSSSKC